MYRQDGTPLVASAICRDVRVCWGLGRAWGEALSCGIVQE